MNNSNASPYHTAATSSSASIALRRISIPNITPLAITRPHREPLAVLDPQSAHSRLPDDLNHSPSSMLAYSQQQSDSKDYDYSHDFASYRIGRQIINRSTHSDEDLNNQFTVPSRKLSMTQAPGLQPNRHTTLRTMPQHISNTRRASVPALHYGSPSTSMGPDSTTPTSHLPSSNPAYINNDELYSGLKSFTFGAARATRASTPDSEMLDPFSNRGADQRPRRSLSAVSTPRDDEFDDEADSARSSRAKMRAIDDGSRQPSLPKNPSSPSPRSHHTYTQPSTTESSVSMDVDRSSTYTFGFAGIYQGYTGQHDMHEEDEHPGEVSSSPVVFARLRQLFADDEEEDGGNAAPHVMPVGNDNRRGSFPMDIPAPSTSANSDGSLRTRRKLSRSLNDDPMTINSGGGAVDTVDTGANAHSEPLTRAEWRNFEQQYQQRRASQTASAQLDEPDPYGGLDLAYIFGPNANATVPRKSWSSGGSFVQHQPSASSPSAFHNSFGGLRFAGAGPESRRPSTATIGEDTFFRHLRVNDAHYEMRLGEWTFGKEKADGPGPNATGVVSGSYIVAPGAHEIWRCQVVGRFTFERTTLPSEPGSIKPPQHRLNVRHIPDPFSDNPRGGPSVVVHKHSRATAFSIFRSHYLFKPRQNSRPSGRADTNHSILLATRKVQEMYTSTKTTNKLKTHGLLEESPKDEVRNSDASRRSEGSPMTQLRTRSRSRKENEKREKEKDKKERTKGKQRSHDTGISSQTTSRDSGFSGSQERSRTDSFVSSWTRHLSGRHVSPPLPQPPVSPPSIPSGSTSPQSTGAQSIAESVTWNTSHSTLESIGPSRSYHPQLHHSSSHLTLKDIDADDEDDEYNYNDQYHLPVQRRSHAETYDSLTPIHHEHARHLLRSNGTPSSASIPRFRKIFPKKSGNTSEWPPSSMVPAPVPWMLTNNSEKLEEGQVVMTNLNDNFGAVGLVPPRQQTRPSRPRRPGGNEHTLLQVPEDSLYMVLPLFAGETEPAEYLDPIYEVPLEERKYLLVYYVPFDQRSARPGVIGSKGTEVPGAATSPDQNKSKSVFLSSFRVSAHLMSYNDFRGSGVRLPSLGLSVTGPLSKATPPDVTPIHMDAIAIAQCSKRESGIELLPEGLHKLGLCHAEEVQSVSLGGDFDPGEEVEFRFELSAIGRAVVEMAWVGAMAVTSFGSV